ncbi:MAG: tRNA pseudouridine(55) synthase TruB [Actinobacteria bacterium]|nr:tRNA pseudouridine(55) synthase TruB [Actinomycetota bacterium]
MMWDGLVVVDKPTGFTSHDVVAKLRKIYGQRRVGHAGTLDPDATGVLLVGLGRVTRLLKYLQASGKEYRADVRFGVATSTLDAAGDVLDRQEMELTRAEVEQAATRFVGDIEQVPPMVSAIKVGGRRLHDLARRGEEVDRAPRPVHIERLEVEEFEPGPYPLATVFVECGSGTYIRTLAADLGAALGGAAHIETLRRLRVGTYGLDEALTLDVIESDPSAAVRPPADAVRDLEMLEVDADSQRAILHGMTFPAGALGESGPGPFAVIGDHSELLAVYERRRGGVKPSVVIAQVAQ